MFSRSLTLLLFAVVSLTCAHAQFEIPDEMFQRTLAIRSGSQIATAFKFALGDQVYLVTTRHFGRNLPKSKARIDVWHDRAWHQLQTEHTYFPGSKDVDLVILETDERIAKPYNAVKSEEVLTTGQPVWFMGWPFLPPRLPVPANMPKTSRPLFPDIPSDTSIGTITGIDPTRPDSFEIKCRGLHSPLIGGGPVFYWSPIHKDYEILGVVKRQETDRTTLNDAKPVNSSRIKSYSMDVVMDIIAQSRSK